MKRDHDVHIHTKLSLCAGPNGGTFDAYMERFKNEGLTKVGFSDHYWDELTRAAEGGFYPPQNTAHVLELKQEIESKAAWRRDGIEVFFGAEAEYDPKRRDVALSEEHAELFDFVIVPNSHTHMIMPRELYEPYEKHRDFMIDAYEGIINSPLYKKILAVAHPFNAVCCPYDFTELMTLMSDDQYKRLFDRTAERGIGVEINVACCRALHNDPESRRAAEFVRMFTLAKECGVKFTFGSDAHQLKEHEQYVDRCEAAVKLCGLTEKDMASLPLKK